MSTSTTDHGAQKREDSFEEYLHEWSRHPTKASELRGLRRMHEAGWEAGLSDAAERLTDLVEEGARREDVSGLPFDWRSAVLLLVADLEEQSGVTEERRKGALN